jgi:hypothetical protein
MLLFQIVQIIYWLALSTWFGSVLFVAVAAPIIFRTVRESNPVLPEVLSVNLEGQHATLLAGSIVGNLLSRLAVLQLACGGVLLLAMIIHPFIIDVGGNNLTAAVLRGVLLLAAVALVVYDWRVIWPRIWQHREQYIQHADDPEVANPAKEQFDRAHRSSVNLLSGVLFLLLGIILFSGSILPRPEERVLPRAARAQIAPAQKMPKIFAAESTAYCNPCAAC